MIKNFKRLRTGEWYLDGKDDLIKIKGAHYKNGEPIFFSNVCNVVYDHTGKCIGEHESHNLVDHVKLVIESCAQFE